MRHGFLLLLLVAAGVGCRRSSAAGPGSLAVAWRTAGGAGGAAFPVRARFCRETGLIELWAVRGDTGVGVVLFSADSTRIPALDYPVFHPERPEVLRPGATIALRWLGVGSLDAYESAGGTVQVQASGGGTVSGLVDALLPDIDRPDTLHLTGRFDRVRVDTAPTGCGRTMTRNWI